MLKDLLSCLLVVFVSPQNRIAQICGTTYPLLPIQQQKYLASLDHHVCYVVTIKIWDIWCLDHIGKSAAKSLLKRFTGGAIKHLCFDWDWIRCPSNENNLLQLSSFFSLTLKIINSVCAIFFITSKSSYKFIPCFWFFCLFNDWNLFTNNTINDERPLGTCCTVLKFKFVELFNTFISASNTRLYHWSLAIYIFNRLISIMKQEW